MSQKMAGQRSLYAKTVDRKFARDWLLHSALRVDRSSTTVHASAAMSPVSRMIWLIHEVRGRPADRFQPWCGASPDLAFMTSFSALFAGVLSDRRRMWPKMEWRRAAMVLSMLVRFVLSGTALLVMKSFHLMPRTRLWQVMWNACSLCESGFQHRKGLLAGHT